MWLGDPCINPFSLFVCANVPRLGGSAHSCLCLGGILSGLLQHAPHGVALADYSEARISKMHRVIMGTPWYAHIIVVLLHWLPVSFWEKFKLLVVIYKAVPVTGPR